MAKIQKLSYSAKRKFGVMPALVRRSTTARCPSRAASTIVNWSCRRQADTKKMQKQATSTRETDRQRCKLHSLNRSGKFLLLWILPIRTLSPLAVDASRFDCDSDGSPEWDCSVHGPHRPHTANSRLDTGRCGTFQYGRTIRAAKTKHLDFGVNPVVRKNLRRE